MVAIAHSDPYSIFMRKIGYSVGLERTLERLCDLQEIYASNKDITVASWNELVRGKNNWNLKSDGIKDVFQSLRLIQRTAGDALVLENLDAISIACAILEHEEERRSARAFLLLWAILVNDGEIFVNLLSARFEEMQIKTVLSALIAKKRSALSEALPGKDSLKRIYRTVNIERQEKNRGSGGNAKSVASLKRTKPLQKGRAFTADGGSTLSKITFSTDYFRKVPPRRKDWARSLGLWRDEYGLTTRGKGFINALKRANYIDEDDLFIFWPMDYELICAGFRPDLLRSTRGLWDCLVDFGGAYSNVVVNPKSNADADNAVVLIKKMLGEFRSLHLRKSMLRRELPITIAYPAAVAIAGAKEEQLIDLPAALSCEQRGEKRRVAIRQSRRTGSALSLRR